MEQPIPLHQALQTMQGDAILTIAAFMLLAGIWHGRRAPEQQVPHWQLETVGFTAWNRDTSHRGKLPYRVFREFNTFDPAGLVSPDDGRQVGNVDGALSAAIERALHTGTKIDTARAVAIGSGHYDHLVRISAHISALDLFDLRVWDLDKLRSQYANDDPTKDETVDPRRLLADSLESVLRRRLRGDLFGEPAIPSPGSSLHRPAGLILIHGTMMPGSRPYWSVPRVGDLFNYIQSTLRPDVYAEPDYFRWEGGYSDYAREVAAENLQDWIERKNMIGTDAVTHSHGGNVLLKATQLGCEFGDVLLLSCPVDERKYKLNKKAVRNVRSLRILHLMHFSSTT